MYDTDSVTQMTRRNIYSKKEINLLRELVSKNLHVLQCRKTDFTSVRSKWSAWAAISDEFNSQEGVSHRTPKQLKKCWENMKSRAKQRLYKLDTEDQTHHTSTAEPEVAAGAAWMQLDQRTVKELTGGNFREIAPRPPPPPPLQLVPTPIPQQPPVSCCNSDTCRRTELSHQVEEHNLRMELLTTQLLHEREEHKLKMEILRLKKRKITEKLHKPPTNTTRQTSERNSVISDTSTHTFRRASTNDMEADFSDEVLVKEEPV